MNRNKLYLLFGFALAVGYGWLAWSISQHHEHHDFSPCIFKNVTGIACPSCGTTRSILHLSQGYFKEAVLINPIGIIIAIVMTVVPLWLAYDLLFKKDTLYKGYKKFESVLQIKWVAIILVILIIMNWVWNIHKGL